MTSITLRPAVMEDAKTLLEWRNDASTRSSSHNSGLVKMDEHVAWLSATLNNPNRKLFVAEEKGQSIGTVRADLSEGVNELSWTVAPSFRGRGLAKTMVSILANRIDGPIRAEVKENNIASIKVAEFAGMTIERNENGVLHFKR
jgi:RimJ/RimL family protein N-acetyltransferase